MTKILSFDNKLMKIGNGLLGPAEPGPQEIIIPVLLIGPDALNYDINDIPLNIPLTFSYNDYTGNPNEPPIFAVFYMFTTNWQSYESSGLISLTDKSATFTVTDKRNYERLSVCLFKSNGEDSIQISDIQGYKLYYI